MTHSPDHAERAYLMTGPWELDPDGTSPGIYADDPSGGDPVCLATIKRLHHPEKLAAALRGRDRVVEALRWALPLAERAMDDHRLERIRCGHSDIHGTYKNGVTWSGIWQAEVDQIEAARAALHDAKEEGA